MEQRPANTTRIPIEKLDVGYYARARINILVKALSEVIPGMRNFIKWLLMQRNKDDIFRYKTIFSDQTFEAFGLAIKKHRDETDRELTSFVVAYRNRVGKIFEIEIRAKNEKIKNIATRGAIEFREIADGVGVVFRDIVSFNADESDENQDPRGEKTPTLNILISRLNDKVPQVLRGQFNQAIAAARAISRLQIEHRATITARQHKDGPSAAIADDLPSEELGTGNEETYSDEDVPIIITEDDEPISASA